MSVFSLLYGFGLAYNLLSPRQRLLMLPIERNWGLVMPFRAECVFCGHQVLAPDHAFGGSACCPKCTNFFTLAPVGRIRATGLSRPLEPPHEAPAGPATLSAGLPRHALDPGPACECAPGPESVQAARVQLVHPLERARPEPRGLDPVGLGAWFAAGAALLCASGPALCRFVLPLGAVGLVLGAAGLLSVLARRTRLLFPATGIAVTCLVLVAAVRFPGLLGPDFLAYRTSDALDPEAMQVVPLPGSPPNAGPADPDWVDASRAGLQQGRLFIEVPDVSIGSVTATSASTRNISPGQYLLLRLRIKQIEVAGKFTAKRSQPPLFAKVRPGLKDNTGKVYPLRDVQEVAAVSERRAAVFPVVFQEGVFLFEPPAAGVAYLRLEVPAEAWGGRGAFRFTIPRSMLRAARAGSTGLADGR